MRKLIGVLTIVVLTATLLSACGEGNSSNQSESNESVSSENMISGVRILSKAELITEENRSLIGTAITSTDSPEVLKPEEQQSNGTEEGGAYEIPENDVIERTYTDTVMPSTITVFEATDGITPEVIAPNNSCGIFVPAPGEKGWYCHEGEALIFDFEKYESGTSTSSPMVVGYILNGVMMDGEVQNDLQGSYKVNVKEDGYYAIYFVSATSDYLALKSGQISLINEETGTLTTGEE